MALLRLARAAIFAALTACAVLPGLAGAALAQSSPGGIIAIVNDQPVTDLDLTQRIALLTVLGDLPPGGMDKKKALKELIDDVVKIQEAKKYSLLPTEADVTDRIKRLADGMKMTTPALLAKLKEKGVSEAAFRSYLTASMGFNRIIQGKYRDQVKATDAEIDAKLAEIKATYGKEMSKIMSDPRMKPITVISLMEIDLPLDGNDPMLLQARAADAMQVLQRFNGCNSLRKASSGVFNVKQGRKFEADAAKLPPKMLEALYKAGNGRAIGPMRSKDGIQLIALCGSRKLTPPKPDFKMPTREQVQRLVINEKYDKLEETYLNTVRDKVYVEYRDQSYALQ